MHLSLEIFLAVLSGITLSLMLGNPIISILKKIHNKGQPIRISSIESQIKKQGTTTMGALIILIPFTILSLIFIDNFLSYSGVILFTTLSFAIIGYLDDYGKITKQKSVGISAKKKLFLSLITSSISLLWIAKISNFNTYVLIPLINYNFDLGYLYWPFALFIIVGSTNAVNLTDGLDSLATLITISVLTSLLIIACTICNLPSSDALQEIPKIISLIIGTCIGFLWFNSYPARIFMGDMGSLALGAFLATTSIILKCELFFAISSIIFIIETLSVIFQVSIRKFTRKFCTKEIRIFHIAPIHHHFEYLNIHEVTITTRLLIISVIAQIISVYLFKMSVL